MKNERANSGARNGIQVMAGLIGMIKPLLILMFFAVLMGSIGHLMAVFITVLGAYGLLSVTGIYEGAGFGSIVLLLLLFAALRGVLRYGEQACNHYIAFKLLAAIRHRVFAALRRLAPAKIDGSGKGNLISIITSDIELLEVFYAHTISPIAIAALTSGFMVFFIGRLHPALGGLAAVFYLIVGLFIPILNGKQGSQKGRRYRDAFGRLNSFVLDNLYGLTDILQYQQKENRMEQMRAHTVRMEETNRRLKDGENVQKIATDGFILLAGAAMAVISGMLLGIGSIEGYECVIAVIAMMSSFGPTAALSALSNNLHHTLASGNRVLDILSEEPVVEDIRDGAVCCDGDIACEQVSFRYGAFTEKIPSKSTIRTKTEGPEVLRDFNAVFRKNRIHGILGKSGCGKSTLLKLMMRFYETETGSISYGNENVNGIATKALRSNVSYVTQETFLFHDTIFNNIKVAKADATEAEVIAAAKKASIHEFILSLPRGYETKLGELGDSVSGGEKQRIGIARAFLHDGNVIFLDEPTSNIDSLNEGIILRSLEREKQNKTILLVSHRKSTMGIADDVVAM